MVNNAVVVPVAVLAALAVAMLIFICWWFPRAWARGQASDRAEYDEARRRRELAAGTAADVELGGGDVAGRKPPESVAVQGAYVPSPVAPY
ncbi:hypothetical protein BUE80_DR011322 [Diplocarpon rosae]|nr:hypothetical protein BUE80_DR011322 [Diplocarpon rosae]